MELFGRCKTRFFSRIRLGGDTGKNPLTDPFSKKIILEVENYRKLKLK